MTLLVLDVRLPEEFHHNRAYVNSWLFYLLLITFVPFSTIVVGRYGSLAPAIWLYAGHLLLIALAHDEADARSRTRRSFAVQADGAMLLVSSAVLTIVLSFVDLRIAMWALALNFIQPALARWGRGRIIPD